MLQKTRRLRWLRAAKINMGLLITFVVMLAIVGGYWGYQWMQVPKVLVTDGPEREFELVCRECKAKTMVKQSETKSIPQKEPGAYECPKCKKFTATFHRPGSIALTPGGK